MGACAGGEPATELPEDIVLTALFEQPTVRDKTTPSGRFRVLCVDDNRDCADSTAKLLQLVGFEARACYDGESALSQLDSYRPDLCFLDLNMRGMDGDELAIRLRAASAGRPIALVAITAMGNEDSRRRTTAAGFDLHLVKPVDPFKLVQVVDTWFKVWNDHYHAHSDTGGSDQ
jgi:CheY-like chemotaxis protein